MVAPVFLLELALTRPSYRDNILTFAVLWAAGSAAPLAVSIPLAIKHRQWRSLLWLPTWVGYAFLRRLGTLEAAISLPTRPFPVTAASLVRTGQRPVPRLSPSRLRPSAPEADSAQ
jgi:hypothetical protein